MLDPKKVIANLQAIRDHKTVPLEHFHKTLEDAIALLSKIETPEQPPCK